MNSSRWVDDVLRLQLDDGSWGRFHTLSTAQLKERPLSTEQALRRLRALGLTKDDPPIQRALEYMRRCLRREIQPPDGREKVINWDAFEALMMATWIRLFDPADPVTAPVVRLWVGLIEAGYAGGSFDPGAFDAAYRAAIPKLNPGERLIDHRSFYMVNLLCGALPPGIEDAYLGDVIHGGGGIYYVYSHSISELPPVFASRRGAGYVAALEQLAGYPSAPDKLRFAADWLASHQGERGEWDMGTQAKDGIYFPVSESWRNAEDRRRDCTERITRLLLQLTR